MSILRCCRKFVPGDDVLPTKTLFCLPRYTMGRVTSQRPIHAGNLVVEWAAVEEHYRYQEVAPDEIRHQGLRCPQTFAAGDRIMVTRSSWGVTKGQTGQIIGASERGRPTFRIDGTTDVGQASRSSLKHIHARSN